MVFYFAGEAMDVPPGTVIGVIGDDSERITELLGQVQEARIHPFGYTLDLLEAYARLRLHNQFESLRRAGDVALIASNSEELLRQHSDELWWVNDGRIQLRGSTQEVLDAYSRHVLHRFQQSAAPDELSPTFRRGDGRAELLSLDLFNADGSRTSNLFSGEDATVVVGVRYGADVEDPVIGIMVRTRIGMEVYGTNTELERVRVGPCKPGDVRTVMFDFRCDLCPGRYTLTAASHDPDGVWHDWMEDAAAFTVNADRYTAGVANLRARVSVSSGSPE